MSSLFAALALTLTLATSGQDAPPSPQVPPTPAPAVDPGFAELEDVVVEGRALEELVRDFVDEVAAPNRRRGLARWSGSVCVGVVNLRQEAAQYMIDRVSYVALGLGLEPGEPGCTPNIIIIGTVNGAEVATAMVEARRRNFDIGSLQMDRGSGELEAFQTSDRPVRWWQVSMPVDADTGQRAIRLPGDVGPDGNPSYPMIGTFASRLRSQIRDDMVRSLIIFDVDRLGAATFEQLTDYVTMLALAQINPEGDAAGYDTILNLFEAPGAPPSLTEWDMGYLNALYASEQARVNPRSQAGVIASDLIRARREASEAEAD